MTVESKEQIRFNNVCDFLLSRSFLSADKLAKLMSSLEKLELTRVDNDFLKRSEAEIERNDEFGNLYDDVQSHILSNNEKFFQYDIQGFEPFKYVVYEEDDFHKIHQDQSMFYNRLYDRKISFTIQLSDTEDYEGGDFEFQKYGEIYQPLPRKGGCMAVYSSAIPHRVRPVTQGQRRAIVGYIYGPPLN